MLTLSRFQLNPILDSTTEPKSTVFIVELLPILTLLPQLPCSITRRDEAEPMKWKLAMA